jgi:uncharacterized protein (TIGR02145 family)
VIGTATPGNAQATVGYTAPADTGGSVITTYTATASPGGFTGSLSQAGSGDIIVTGLTNGTEYTFTVTATNGIGRGDASAPSTGVTPVALPTSEVASNNTGGTYTFLAHNLGADTSLDPHTPVLGLQGGYVQWGKPGPIDWVGAANDGPNGFAAAPTSGDANEDGISGWSSANMPSDSWNVNENTPLKVTANDPCPSGFRVPTRNEWVAVDNYNTDSLIGETWVSGDTQYFTALHYGPDASTKLLTLPAAGRRTSSSGSLGNRGSKGYYWSSRVIGSNAYYVYFTNGGVYMLDDLSRTGGFSVRCIAE